MKNKRIIYMSCILCATAFLSGCRIYSSYERPEDISADSLYRDTKTETGILATDTVNFGNTPWREVFTDPKLQALIEKGLERNTDLLAAELSVKQAEASLMSSKLSFLPSFALAPQGNLSSFDKSSPSKTYTLPVTASWQIDIFGSLRNAKAQAKALYLQSKEYKQAVQTQIIASIANMYYTLLMLDEQLNITKETAEIWGKNVEAMKAMQVAAMTNAAAVSQSEANYYQVCASIPELERSIRETENALSTLLREAPHKIDRTTLAEQTFSESLSAGVPLQLLSNRPDVKAAELNLRAAFYNTNAAYSAFYPQITLSGTAGWTNSAGSAIVNPGKLILNAIGSLTQPIFQRGKLIAGLKVAKAQQETAKLQFEQALLNAGEEVSNALFLYQTAIQTSESREKQVEALTKTRDNTIELFNLGTSTYLEKLTAEQSLLSARLSLISDELTKMQADVNLYQALGGGRAN